MNTAYPNLFSPFSIGSLELKNRIVMAPMGGAPADEAEYYIERARGGTGLIISGIRTVQGKLDLPLHVIFDDPVEFLSMHVPMLEKVHAYGSKMFMQLTAGFGRVAAPMLPNMEFIGPSELPDVWNPAVKTRPLTVEEIRTYIKGFVKAAMLCKQAGLDGVEIHAVHEGYLLDQFAVAATNHRTDEYGGCLENRARFATDIVKSIKNVCGKDFPVTLRYSVRSYMKSFNSGAVFGEKFQEFGRDLEEGLELAKLLEKAGYDALNCDNGSYDAWYWPHPPMYMPEGLNVVDVAKVKEAVSIPVIVAGRLENPKLAERVLADQKADAIGIGRQLLADPQYPNRVKEGRLDEIKPCIACHIGCLARVFSLKSLSCAVNPYCGNEKRYAIVKATEKKSIMIVGGGVAGMEAAIVCAKRGYETHLYEKERCLGGVFNAAAAFSFKDADRRLLQWYQNELAKTCAHVHLNTEVDQRHIEEQNPDIILAATGAKQKTLKLEGGGRVRYAVEFLLGDQKTGQHVVVIGGGISGCEIAYELAKDGKDVTIVEMLPQILPDPSFSAANKNCLKELLIYHKVKVLTQSHVGRIGEDTVTVASEGGEQTLKADTVIAAIGYTSDTTLYDRIRLCKKQTYLLGDAQYVSNILNAIWSANEVARSI